MQTQDEFCKYSDGNRQQIEYIYFYDATKAYPASGLSLIVVNPLGAGNVLAIRSADSFNILVLDVF